MSSNYVKILTTLLGIATCWNSISQNSNVNTAIIVDTPICDMPPSEINNKFYVPRQEFVKQRMNDDSSRNSCSTFIVNYSGFPLGSPERDAFQFAIDIWESLLDSDVPIRVNAAFNPPSDPEDNDTNLGSASPAFYMEVPGLTNPNASVLYPGALFEKLTGQDSDGPTGESIDITCRFNSLKSNWYFGTDGNTPQNQLDFVSVVLHELGHGLGVAGFGIEFPANSGTGNIRRDASGFSVSESSNHVSVWDTYIEAQAPGFPITKELVIDESEFADPSVVMFNAFRGGSNSTLSCNSPLAVLANGGNEPRTYAPATFRPGSSYSHWDEAEFNNTPNALMTPFLNAAEAVHDPGNITLGFMEDMGWSLCQGSLSTNNFVLENIKISPNPFTESITISLPLEVANQQFDVTIVDINGRIVSRSSEATNGKIVVKNLENLKSALYFLTIKSKTSDLSITKKIIKQ
ncbi:MAG: T9SS type A sorting domain-containing protein [Winogradskyella sp.]|uniref:T9SS type A sorting domain-containing protein n=1 Tax=Winogradskyella sp. TaxID=1883156 RepID=UPI0017F04976|nr:T9SS type A sorting domain-containing protein [Winogradskyella sp.]MBT8245249.1 zinc-dependent metalloprotease [Winogradskyella sp.]NNK23038.1 T9SS type A sorting domain-containing protein [Winogradskyella sp.]